MRPNKPNRAELESTIFIVVAWAGEGYKVTKFRRYPFQSAHLGALAGRQKQHSQTKTTEANHESLKDERAIES